MKSNRLFTQAWHGAARRHIVWLPAFAAAAFLLVNLPGMSGGFFSDDGLYILQNEALQSLAPSEAWKVFLYSARYNGLDWGPLRDLAYKAVLMAFGQEPLPFKLLNYVAYGWAVFAAYRAVLAILPVLGMQQAHAARTAAIAAGLFAVHPLHVESVQAIWGLKDLLMAGFGLAAFPPFIRWVTMREPKALALGAVLLACAGMSKGVSVSLLVPMWLLAYAAQRERAMPRRAWDATRAFLPVAVLPALVFAAFLYASPLQDLFNGIDVHNWTDRPLIILGGQTLIALVPWPLSLVYAPYGQWMPVYLALGVAAFAASLGSLWSFAKRPAALSFGMLFFAAMLLPYLQLAPFSTTSMMADRFGFVAVLGLCIATAVAVMRLPRSAGVAAASVLLAAFIGLAAVRGSGWADPDGLQAADVQRTQPETAGQEHRAIASAMERVGQVTAQVKMRGGRMLQNEADELIAYLGQVQAALAQPRPATSDMAALAFYGRVENDVAGVYRSIYDYYGAHPLLGADASTHFLRNRRYRQAQQWAQFALATPGVPEERLAVAYQNLGIALAAQGDIPGGANALYQSLRVRPDANSAACALRDLARSYPAQVAFSAQLGTACERAARLLMPHQ